MKTIHEDLTRTDLLGLLTFHSNREQWVMKTSSGSVGWSWHIPSYIWTFSVTIYWTHLGQLQEHRRGLLTPLAMGHQVSPRPILKTPTRALLHTIPIQSNSKVCLAQAKNDPKIMKSIPAWDPAVMETWLCQMTLIFEPHSMKRKASTSTVLPGGIELRPLWYMRRDTNVRHGIQNTDMHMKMSLQLSQIPGRNYKTYHL